MKSLLYSFTVFLFDRYRGIPFETDEEDEARSKSAMMALVLFVGLWIFIESARAEPTPTPTPAPTSAWEGSPLPMFEIAASAPNVATIAGINDPSATLGISSGADMMVHFGRYANITAETLYTGTGGRGHFQFRASGNLWFFNLHELYLRQDAWGQQTRILMGFGDTLNLPQNLGYFTATLGAAIINQRFNPAMSTREDTSHAGAFAGGILVIRVKKFENDLRVAWAVVQNTALTSDDISNVDFFSLIRNADTPAFLYERLFYRLFEWKQLVIGPELRVEYNGLPEGTEFLTTIGFRAKARF